MTFTLSVCFYDMILHSATHFGVSVHVLCLVYFLGKELSTMAAIALNQALAQRFILCMRLHFTHAV